MQGRSPVQKHGVLDDDFFQLGHRHRVAGFDHFLCSLDADLIDDFRIVGIFFDQRVDDERLEENQSHFPGNPALVHLQFRADDDDAPTGIVDAFPKQILAESSLLSAQQIRKRLQGPVPLHDNLPVLLAVVNQSINRFLQHPFLVFGDEAGRALFVLLLQAVVPVQNSSVEIVQIGGREASAVELNHGTQIRRQHGDDIHDHPFGLVSGFREGLDDLQALDDFFPSRLRCLKQFRPEFLAGFLQIQFLQEFLNRFGSGQRAKTRGTVFPLHITVFLFGHDVPFLETLDRARIGHDVGSEVNNVFHIPGLHVKQKGDFRGRVLQKPCMDDRGGEFYVPHAFAAHFAFCEFDAAAFASIVFALGNPSRLPASALVILCRTEDDFAEESVALRFQGSVIDGFMLFDFTVAPAPDFFRRRDTNLHVFIFFQFITP